MQTALQDVVAPVVACLGLELDSLTTVRAGSRTVVRIALDGDGASGHGLSVDEIAAAATAISQRLDDIDVAGDRGYVLEVGSPGVDRPLTQPQHWRRNVGHLVTITTTTGQTRVDRITGSDTAGVSLEAAGYLPYADVRHAVVQAELKPMPDVED